MGSGSRLEMAREMLGEGRVAAAALEAVGVELEA